MRWDSSSERFTFLYNQRGHQILRGGRFRARWHGVRLDRRECDLH